MKGGLRVERVDSRIGGRRAERSGVKRWQMRRGAGLRHEPERGTVRAGLASSLQASKIGSRRPLLARQRLRLASIFHPHRRAPGSSRRGAQPHSEPGLALH
jgi:hypothetical protein